MRDASSGRKQQGAALILFVFLVAMAATGYVIKTLSASYLERHQDQQASLVLAKSKAALIGHALSRTGTGERPGNMPRPDYISSSESPSNYDGTSDSGCLNASQINGLPLISSGGDMRCLGRLPWKELGISFHAPSESDQLGNMPWYAVSANLVDPVCLDVINPSILSRTHTTYICSGGALPHPWLTVRDANGNVLSNRVALVLMLPGRSLQSQVRGIAPLNGSSDYLDAVVIPDTCTAPCVPGTYSNADMDNDFIVSSSIAGATDSSNDRLIYVTIDELMVELVKRAAVEAKRVIRLYEAEIGHYPYAAPLGASSNSHISSGVSTAGMIPVDATDTCACTSSTSCACNFKLLADVSYRRSSGTWASNTGSCTRTSSNTTCKCTGAGSCTRTTIIIFPPSISTSRFQCDSSGICTSTNSPGAYKYTPKSSYADLYSSSGGCDSSGSCDDSGSLSIGLNEADWFKENDWQHYFYYEWSASSDLALGSKNNLEAILIGTGDVISSGPPFPVKGSPQSRPSSSIADYLDSDENTDGDQLYDSTQTSRSTTYNDQSFIISP